MDKKIKKIQIAILGSHRDDLKKEIYELAYEIGVFVAQNNFTLITGASSGISKYAAKGAIDNKGLVVAVSPRGGPQDKSKFTIDESNSSAVIYTGMGYKGRNVITTRSADVVVVINGGFGTLNEVAIAEGENKNIITLIGTGGCADMLPEIFKRINPKYRKFSKVKNIQELKKIINELRL